MGKIKCVKEKQVKWSEKAIEALIEAYKLRPCLWQLNHKDYMNRNAKNKAIEELVEIVKPEVPDVDHSLVKTKIQNIRSSFRKERRKVECTLRSGSGAEDIYEPTLWYYNLLLFTKDQEAPVPSVSNDEEHTSDQAIVIDDEYFDDSENADMENADLEEASQQQQEPYFKQPSRPPAKRKAKELEKDMSTFLKKCTSALSSSSPSDDCAALSTFVSEKLRKMDDAQQILAESLIHQVITKGLLKRLTMDTALVETTKGLYSPASSSSASSTLTTYYTDFGTDPC